MTTLTSVDKPRYGGQFETLTFDLSTCEKIDSPHFSLHIALLTLSVLSRKFIFGDVPFIYDFSFFKKCTLLKSLCI